MIARINQMWSSYSGTRHDAHVNAMVRRHDSAFKILDLVNRGLATPTEAAYRGCLLDLETELREATLLSRPEILV